MLDIVIGLVETAVAIMCVIPAIIKLARGSGGRDDEEFSRGLTQLAIGAAIMVSLPLVMNFLTSSVNT